MPVEATDSLCRASQAGRHVSWKTSMTPAASQHKPAPSRSKSLRLEWRALQRVFVRRSVKVFCCNLFPSQTEAGEQTFACGACLTCSNRRFPFIKRDHETSPVSPRTCGGMKKGLWRLASYCQRYAYIFRAANPHGRTSSGRHWLSSVHFTCAEPLTASRTLRLGRACAIWVRRRFSRG
jgi:hypothetical protein